MERRHHKLQTLATCFALIGLLTTLAAAQDSGYETLDLSSFFNADLFTHEDNRTDGQVDGGRSTFPAETMPKSDSVFKTYGIDFVFPSKEDGDQNAIKCEGQVIPVDNVAADYIFLLATAADGNQRSPLRLEHEDGTVIEAMFDVNDWCAENPGLGGVHGLVTDYRHTLGGPQSCKTTLWMVPVRLRSASPLTSITLPKNPNIFIVASTLGPAGEERRVQTYIKDAFVASEEAGIDRLVLLSVVEPETNSVLTLSAGDPYGSNLSEMVSFDLKSGVQSIPVWLPVMKKRTYFFDIGDTRMTSLDETNLIPNTPKAMIRLAASNPVHPSDAGVGMAPAWQICAEPDSELTAGIHIIDCPANELTVRSIVAPRDGIGEVLVAETNIQVVMTSAASTDVAVDVGDLTPGEYTVNLSVLLNGLEYAQKGFILTVVEPGEANQPFGAREVVLGYRGPVWTNWDESIAYEDAWENPDMADIVVDYPGQPYRYVFWKGMSYCPVWMFDRTFVSCEWMEAWPRQEGAVDCVEPLQDKECKYSRIELLSSTPARARIKWNYAETDFNLKVIHDETAEEIYTMYPDGIAARKITGDVQKDRWHEVHEFIVGSVAGSIPSEHMEAQTVSLLNCDGDRLDLHWPTPQESDMPVWDEYIGLVHLKNNPSVFMACNGFDTGIHVYSNNPDWLPEVFFCMPHWPLQRGLPTTNERTIEECQNRATHASLINIYASPYTRFQNQTVWGILIGIAPDDEEELRDLVQGWLNPPTLEITSETPLEHRYDIFERGYVIDFADQSACALTIDAEPDYPQVRPALVLDNAGVAARCDVSMNGMALVEGEGYLWGTEEADNRVVVWLNRTLKEPTEIKITLSEDTEQETANQEPSTVNRELGTGEQG